MKFLQFLFVILAIYVNADIATFFKKVEGKSDIHNMKNIDFIYMINLDERPEKYANCITQLEPYGIYPYRFSAVNGWKLSISTMNELGVKFSSDMKGGWWGTYYPVDGDGSSRHEIIGTEGRCYFSHCMSPGAIGIVMSHLSVLQDAYNSGYETIWVMEDDIEIKKNPHLISDCIERMDAILGKENWDILFTDKDTKNDRGEYVPCFSYASRPNFKPSNPKIFETRHIIPKALVSKIGARYGAYSMILRRSGIKKILNFIKKHQVFLPYDMEYTLPPGIRMYAVLEDIVSTLIQAPTDNGKPNYNNSL